MQNNYFPPRSLFIFIFSIIIATNISSEEIAIQIDDNKNILLIPSVVRDNILFAPFIRIAEHIGASANWRTTDSTLVVRYRDKALALAPNNKQMSFVSLNSNSIETINIPPPFEYNSAIYCPVKIIIETLGLYFTPLSPITYQISTPEYRIAMESQQSRNRSESQTQTQPPQPQNQQDQQQNQQEKPAQNKQLPQQNQQDRQAQNQQTQQQSIPRPQTQRINTRNILELSFSYQKENGGDPDKFLYNFGAGVYSSFLPYTILGLSGRFGIGGDLVEDSNGQKDYSQKEFAVSPSVGLLLPLGSASQIFSNFKVELPINSWWEGSLLGFLAPGFDVGITYYFMNYPLTLMYSGLWYKDCYTHSIGISIGLKYK